MMKRVVKRKEGGGYKMSLMLTQDYNNVGLYTPTDGDIGQLDVLCNFVLQTSSSNNVVTIKDGIDTVRYGFTKGLTYQLDWGDGFVETYQVNGQANSHIYVVGGEYEVTMTINSPWGRHREIKTINIPSTDTVNFDMNITTPELLGYDNEMVGYVNTSGVIVCEGAVSRLNELKKYGTGLVTSITDSEGMDGENGISQINGNVYTYYIDRIKYVDNLDERTSTIYLYPNNFTSGGVVKGVEYINEMLNLTEGPVVHQEVFNGVTGDIDIQSDIFVERGKQAPFEFYYKLGEISNMKELEQNGNKFFTVNNMDDFKL